MRYVSTRGQAPILDFEQVLLTGLARDGGLYVPEFWTQFTPDDIRSLRGLSYPKLATRIMLPFVEGCLTESELSDLIHDAYANFTHPAVAPLRQLDHRTWIMELFHGPTLAFKDYALQLVGRLFDYVLTRKNQRIMIVGATSGDTGSSAIEACRDRDAIDIVILHPKGRTSDVQRRQMTTVDAPNVLNLAVEGTFDDCQNLVKALFNDHRFRDEVNLSAVNSINWARIMAQITYYFFAATSLGAPDIAMNFAVPTGNFGNVFAGYCAYKMGLPVNQFLIGSNSNDILTRFFATGIMQTDGVIPTLSPSMDIQLSSNFERLIWDMVGRDGALVRQLMDDFHNQGVMTLPDESWRSMTNIFSGYRFNDAQTLKIMRDIYQTTGEILDPHSAIGVGAALKYQPLESDPIIAFATAHPAKFPAAVKDAMGTEPPLPAHLADLFQRPEKYQTIENDLAMIQSVVKKFGQR